MGARNRPPPTTVMNGTPPEPGVTVVNGNGNNKNGTNGNNGDVAIEMNKNVEEQKLCPKPVQAPPPSIAVNESRSEKLVLVT